ncbi:hypothetical protein D9757_009222 [Collybiopsis confluens]|uniref:DUF6534 domain-containing protein n=1 Tax=Collybiopsis confluens TaxID=2823264 RepID=A0A8H5HAF5_9AGAR|nr:hypothetical protein D9757_009222 [Collybiopsis confluens]
MIAGILTLLLQRSKTGFRSLCAVASLISILAAPNTFIYISFFFSIGRLYTNSLLATLNARKMIRKAADDLQTHTTTMMSECHGNEGLENNDDDDDDVDVEEYENGDGEEEAKRRSDGLGEDSPSGVARKVARRRKRVRASTRRRAESRLIFHRAKSFTFGTTGNDGSGRNGTGNGMGNNIDISIQVDTTREYISDGRIGYRKSLVQAHHHHHHRQADMAVLRSAPASLSDIDMDSEILGRDSTRMTTTEVEDGDYRFMEEEEEGGDLGEVGDYQFMEEEEEGGDLGEVGLSDSMARSIKSFLSITTGSGGHIEGHAV